MTSPSRPPHVRVRVLGLLAGQSCWPSSGGNMHAWEVIRCAAQHKVHGRIAAANCGEADRQALPAGMRLDLSATSMWRSRLARPVGSVITGFAPPADHCWSMLKCEASRWAAGLCARGLCPVGSPSAGRRPRWSNRCWLPKSAADRSFPELDEIGCLGWGRGQQGWAIPLRVPDEASAPGAMPTQAQKAEKTPP